MRTKHVIVMFAALGVAGALISSWHDRRLRAGQEIALAEIRQQRAAVAAEMRRVERLAGAAASAAGRAATVSTVGDAASAAEIAAVKRSAESDEERRSKKELWFAAQREKNAARFAPLFRTRGLSAETIGQFQAALDQQQREGDHRTEGAGSEVALAEKLRAFLPEAEVRAAMEFERTLPVRDMIASLAGRAALIGQALSPAQAERLTAIILEVTPRVGNEGEWLQTDGIDWSAVDMRARDILSDAQLDVLKTAELSFNGRFGARLDRAIEQARQADAAKRSTEGSPSAAEAKQGGR